VSDKHRYTALMLTVYTDGGVDKARLGSRLVVRLGNICSSSGKDWCQVFFPRAQ